MKNKILPVIVFVLVLSMSLGFILLYNGKSKKDEVPEPIIKNVELLSTFSNGDKISINDFTKPFEKKYNFNIKNTNVDTVGYYRIEFRIITPLANTINNDFTYMLTSDTESIDKNNVLVSKESSVVPISSINIGSGVITPKTIHNYTLTLNYKGNLGKRIFVSQIEVVGEDK